MRKVVLVTSSLAFGGGLSKYICTLANILWEEGHSVAIVSTHAARESCLGSLALIDEECTFYSLADRNKAGRYLDLLFLLRKLAPNLIINNYNAVCQHVAPFLCSETALVHVLHNDTPDFYRIGSIHAQSVDGWIAPSQAIADHFNAYTQNRYRERVTVIPHGVESADGEPAAAQAGGRKELVYVGTLMKHKGVLLLPKIIRGLERGGEVFHFSIIGDGELRGDLSRKLEREIRTGLVEMTGTLPPDEVYTSLRRADVFVYPTHVDAFGLVIAEAMMNAAVPVVSLLEGVTDDIVDENENGFLVPIDDAQAFIDKISRLIHDDALLTTMKSKASRKARAYFSLEAMKTHYRSYLNQIQERRRPHA
ncbi:MAG: glycosyltransferase family 4 protein [Akkermansiaceae bacterium]|nr:glycosyltransferase family 4 protein [Akkermansiaceae bacterium]